MIEINKKHLTLICFRGGYGGDFLCGLIDQALNNSQLIQRDLNNRYSFYNYIFPFDQKIKNLQGILRYYYAQKDKKISRPNLWDDNYEKIYNMCYDEDAISFSNNILEYIKSLLHLKYEYNVGSIHFMGGVPTFDLRNIHDQMSIIFLENNNDLYFHYFHVLFEIKLNYRKLKNRKYVNKTPAEWDSPPYAINIDAGKLFFEDTLDNTISETLSKIIGKEIIIDIDELKRYRFDNEKILIQYFGEDFKSLDASSFMERKYELFDSVLNAK